MIFLYIKWKWIFHFICLNLDIPKRWPSWYFFFFCSIEYSFADDDDIRTADKWIFYIFESICSGDGSLLSDRSNYSGRESEQMKSAFSWSLNFDCVDGQRSHNVYSIFAGRGISGRQLFSIFYCNKFTKHDFSKGSNWYQKNWFAG